jgi:macrodomain Ter protein organizer (MatP/YcbG family)
MTCVPLKPIKQSISFDQVCWELIHEMANELSCGVSAAVRILIRQEATRRQQHKELCLEDRGVVNLIQDRR